MPPDSGRLAALRRVPQLPSALVLGGAAALGALALLPYAMALQPEAFAELPLPLPVVALLQLVQGGLLFTGLAFVGLRAGAAVGLGAPLLAARVEAGAPARPLPVAGLAGAAVLGALGAVGVALLDGLFALPVEGVPVPAPWKGALASLYGAIAEELQLRVFLMGGIAWLLQRLRGGVPGGWPVPVAVVLAALLFGVGHLPAAFALWDPGLRVVLRTLVLNGGLGMLFGALYWRRGLAHAVVAHLAADLVLHVALPLVG